MSIRHRQLAEAVELLKKIKTWDEEEIEELPNLYRRKAQKYRGLLQDGME